MDEESKPRPPNYRDIQSCANCDYSIRQCYEWYDCGHPDHPLEENGETKICDDWKKKDEP